MSNATSEKTELDLNIGADVTCTEGRCGKLIRVVIDPRTQRVTDLIVEKGFLQKVDRVIPVTAVEEATGESIRLNVDADAFKDFQEYDETSVRLPVGGYRGNRYRTNEVVYLMGRYRSVFVEEPIVPTVEHKVHEGVPTELDVIGSGTPVRNMLGDLGEVDHLLINADTNRITHLVVKTKGLFSDYPVVPISDVSGIDEAGIFIKVSEEELREYPRYSPTD
jgi:uncharacterized protein YrrD